MTEARPGDAFQTGDVLNNTYRIDKLLGRGGTSDVYRARNEISGRLVAIKVLKSEFSGNDDYLVLMTREEEIREVRHDAIVRYSENHRTSEGLVYLVMDYIDGPGLDQKLKEGPMSAEDLLTLCKRVGEGLRAAHRRSIVHRDLSPDNIILRDGEPAQAVVIDFGIAKDTNPGAETIVGNEFAGKYAYAAPEQLSGQTDARSDIYSLGALLLANFRGKSPDIGANPMEVVKKKGELLDTSCVPEPLKTLLDRMTAPDPQARFQSMDDVLSFIDGGGAEDALSDATVIVAPPKAAKKEVAKPTAKSVKKKEKSGGLPMGVMAAAAVVVLGGGGAAAFFGGFLGGGGPEYPPVDPYSLVIRSLEDFDVAASGYVPSTDMQNALVSRMDDLGGNTDVTLASGEIAPSWGDDVLTVLDDITVLSSWELSVTQNTATITGTTDDPNVLSALTAKYPENWPGALNGTIDVVLTSVFLDANAVDDLLSQSADCGPLFQINDPGPVGYGPDDIVRIGGTLLSEQSRLELQSALDELADGRLVSVETDQLNETLCLVQNYLPSAPESDIDIALTDGQTGQSNRSGRFAVGESPVVDVIIPADITDGYLSVSIIDVSGSVFHLLPNVTRPNNAVADLREGKTGDIPLRVVFSVFEPRTSGQIGFQVDGSTLGKSKVMVLHSQEPLFSTLRPTTESATGYAEALSALAANGNQVIKSLDTVTMTMVE